MQVDEDTVNLLWRLRRIISIETDLLGIQSGLRANVGRSRTACWTRGRIRLERAIGTIYVRFEAGGSVGLES
jgi:hypothetical protein